MRDIKMRFRLDKSIDHIDILITADAKDEDIETLVRRIKPNTSRQFTVLDEYDRSCVLNEDEIVSITSDVKNVRIKTKEKEYRARQSMQNMEKLLSDMFLRVSRFEIVNLARVSKYDFTIVGTLRIEFDNGTETWASRRYIPLIKERLSGEEGYLC